MILSNTGKKAVAHSALWRALESAGSEGLAFLVFIFMARLLLPDQFGSVAIATAIVALLQVLVYHGFSEALIQREQLESRHVNAVFVVNFSIALGLVILFSLLAIPLSWVLHRPDFPKLFWALLPTLLLQSLAFPMHALLRRGLEYKTIAIRTLIGAICGGVLGLLLAWLGAGSWALVVQQWAVVLVGFIVLLIASPIKPWSMQRDRQAVRELVPMAKPVMLAQFLSNASRRLDSVALGLYLSDHEVGLYFLAVRLIWAVQMVTQHSITEVGLVVLSKMQDDEKRHKTGVRQSLAVTLFTCFFCFGLLAVCSQWLIPLFFGSIWQPASQPLYWLAVLSPGGAVVSITGAILISGGDAGAYSRLAIATSFLQLLAVFIAARWGLLVVAIVVGMAQLMSVAPALYLICRRFNINWRLLLADMLPLIGGYLIAIGLTVGVESTTFLGAAWAKQTLSTGVFIGLMVFTGWIYFRNKSWV